MRYFKRYSKYILRYIYIGEKEIYNIIFYKYFIRYFDIFSGIFSKIILIDIL